MTAATAPMGYDAPPQRVVFLGVSHIGAKRKCSAKAGGTPLHKPGLPVLHDALSVADSCQVGRRACLRHVAAQALVRAPWLSFQAVTGVPPPCRGVGGRRPWVAGHMAEPTVRGVAYPLEQSPLWAVGCLERLPACFSEAVETEPSNDPRSAGVMRGRAGRRARPGEAARGRVGGRAVHAEVDRGRHARLGGSNGEAGRGGARSGWGRRNEWSRCSPWDRRNSRRCRNSWGRRSPWDQGAAAAANHKIAAANHGHG